MSAPVINVLVPTHSHCPALFAYDLASMYAFTATNAPDGTTLGLSFNVGTYVHSARWDLLKAAQEVNATYLCWLDSDMRFPRDALLRLLAHDKDVVGINYCTRGLPPHFVAIRKIGQGGTNVPTHEDSTGLERVEALGMGLVVIKGEVLKRLPTDGPPWFWFDWFNGRMVGEDVYFFRLLRDLGIEVYIDHDLSKECRHIGDFEYATHHVDAWDAADAVFKPNGESPSLIVRP
jgi:hypothetical protein